MLPPLNLLALDTTAFEADLGTWKGVQAADSGFQTTFSGLRQDTAPAAAALQLFVAGSAIAPLLPISPPVSPISPAPGDGLPPAGKRLPLEEAEAGLRLPASPDTADLLPGVLEALGPVVPRNLPEMTAVPVSLPAPLLSAATDVDVPGDVPAAVWPGAGSTGLQETAVRVGQATMPDHLRYVAPAATAGASAAIVAGDAPEAEMSASQPRETPATIREPGVLQQFVQQAMQPVRAKAGAPTVDVLPQADLADARPAPSAPAPLYFAAMSATAAASPTQWVASQVHTPPGQPGWGEALGERVLWMTGNGLKNAELRLNPAELGPVRVQISVDDGNTTVSFSAQHPLTRDAIEQALPRLREMLAEQGLSLQNADVSEGRGGDHSGPGRQDDVPGFSPGAASPALQADGPALPATRHAVGLVDLFA